MQTLNDIKIAIESELKHFENIENYDGSAFCLENEMAIIKAYEDILNYEIEENNEAMEYFLHATMEEIWHYHLDIIIPSLKN
jgi:hypothetical protein